MLRSEGEGRAAVFRCCLCRYQITDKETHEAKNDVNHQIVFGGRLMLEFRATSYYLSTIATACASQ
jgi:hypothetical protein